MSKFCQLRRKCCISIYGQKCGKFHHPLLHGVFSEGLIYNLTLSVKSLCDVKDKTLLMISKVYSNGTPLNTLWDPGNDISYPLNIFAASTLGLKGRDVDLTITKVDKGTKRLKCREYVIQATDLENKHWYITAYGIEKITSAVCKVNFTNAVQLFNGICLADLKRPVGEIELLVGSNRCTLMPQVKQYVGNLQLMCNMFGYCKLGSHPLIKFDSPNNDSFKIRVNHLVGAVQVKDIDVEDQANLRMDLDTFFNIENLGTHWISKYGGCKCGSCTIKEERELAMITEGLTYNSEGKYMTIRYPWVKNPNYLRNNIAVAVPRMKSTERGLNKLGSDYMKLYNNQIKISPK